MEEGARNKREPKESQRELFAGLSRAKDALEKELARRHGHVAGVDEVGRGCLAGPVVAAAVVLAPEVRIKGITDSKLLSPARREELDLEIKEKALAIGLGVVEAAEIDRVNILNASLEAMRLAVGQLAVTPGFLIVDGIFRISSPLPQQPVIKGDLKCRCVGAASIVAKVWRDRRMAELDGTYPGYGFAAHKGYGCKSHWSAIERLGPSPIHRRSFADIGGIPPGQPSLFTGDEDEGES